MTGADPCRVLCRGGSGVEPGGGGMKGVKGRDRDKESETEES